MFVKVAFLVINIILLGADLQGTNENEFFVVSTSESPKKEIETISKIEETNRHLVAVLTHMVEAQKSAKTNEICVESTNAKLLVQFQKILQQAEKNNEQQQENWEKKNEKILEIQKKLNQQEKTLEEHEKTLQQVEKSNEQQQENWEKRNEKILEIQKKLDQQEKTLEEYQKNFHKIQKELGEHKQKNAELQKALVKRNEEISKALARIEENQKLESKKFVSLEEAVNGFLNPPRNCKEIKESGNHFSGVYLIRPKSRSLNVWCDMDTNGGGWTVLQNRFDGSEDFSRDWADYKQGFGNLHGEFWLGLQHIHELTETKTNELLIKLVDRNNTEAYASYNNFTVGSEYTSYTLETLGVYKGSAGESLLYHLAKKFSTRDRDHSTSIKCTPSYPNGWWFGACFSSNLNGKYFKDGISKGQSQGINWYTFSTNDYSLVKSKMMIRPR